MGGREKGREKGCNHVCVVVHEFIVTGIRHNHVCDSSSPCPPPPFPSTFLSLVTLSFPSPSPLLHLSFPSSSPLLPLFFPYSSPLLSLSSFLSSFCRYNLGLMHLRMTGIEHLIDFEQVCVYHIPHTLQYTIPYTLHTTYNYYGISLTKWYLSIPTMHTFVGCTHVHGIVNISTDTNLFYFIKPILFHYTGSDRCRIPVS